MLEHFEDLIDQLADTPLAKWAEQMPAQIAEGLSSQRFGDLPQWLAALARLPNLKPEYLELKTQVVIGSQEQCSQSEFTAVKQSLEDLIPWRKGPFEVFGVHIDTEWRSDWKWHRLLPHIQPLEGRTVLDVGCGNGYHCWRMLGEGASRVIGVDPSPRFVVQFLMIKHFLGKVPVHVLPVPLESVPANTQAFDTTFSMGVLYHRRSPFDHLKALKETLKPGGELVLETLVIDGPEGQVLVPKDRYAMMNNVWFLPSCLTLEAWLAKIGFKEVRLVDVNETTTEEQRPTDWMRFHSLQQFLDPTDPTKTIEGYPRPKRAVLVAST